MAGKQAASVIDGFWVMDMFWGGNPNSMVQVQKAMAAARALNTIINNIA
jgi:hypothetical protein